ncbi:MAG: hypothetical protein Q8Q25_01425 [bacterium]|nr:hypothetical protein [bacterium]
MNSIKFMVAALVVTASSFVCACNCPSKITIEATVPAESADAIASEVSQALASNADISNVQATRSCSCGCSSCKGCSSCSSSTCSSCGCGSCK